MPAYRVYKRMRFFGYNRCGSKGNITKISCATAVVDVAVAAFNLQSTFITKRNELPISAINLTKNCYLNVKRQRLCMQASHSHGYLSPEPELAEIPTSIT